MNVSSAGNSLVRARLRGRLITATLVALTSLWLAGERLAAQEPSVASFEPVAADPAPAAAADPDSSSPQPVLSFSFRFAPWDDVLVKFADVAGLTLDLTDVPPGTFSYRDKGRYNPTEALDVLNGYLLQRGFALVRRDRFLVCVNLTKGVPANLIPMITVDQLPDFGEHDLVSVILSHPNMDSSLAAAQIARLQGAHGKVVSLNAQNTLLVTDTSGNVRLIQRLLQQGAFTPRVSAASGTAFRAYVLDYVRADEAERLIRSLYGLPPAGKSAMPGADGVAAAPAIQLSITTDARRNQLFVTANRATLASIEEIVEAYDVPDTPTDEGPRRGAPTTRLVPLGQADVIVIGRALESLSPRLRVSTTHSTRRPPPTETPSSSSGSRGSGTPASDSPREPTPQTPAGRDR